MQMISQAIMSQKIGIMQITIVSKYHKYWIKQELSSSAHVFRAEIVIEDYTYTKYAEIILIYGEYKKIPKGWWGFNWNVFLLINIEHKELMNCTVLVKPALFHHDLEQIDR